MESTIVLSKTQAARSLLAQRDAELARTERSFLIMVDGRRNLAQLQPMMDALGMTLDAVKNLVAQGLLHLQHEAELAAQASQVVRRERNGREPLSAAAPAKLLAKAAVAALPASLKVEAKPLAPPKPEPKAAEAAGNRSLAAAKFYALNLVTLMLVGQDDAPRRAVREANTPQQLVDWLSMCLDLVRDSAGPDRAQLFADKIWAVLPDDARELLAQDWAALLSPEDALG
jgi:hypothetical protein